MKVILAPALLAALWLAACGSSALAQDSRDMHPTITAVHRYGHRKVAHVTHAVHYAGHNARAWKHRKTHNVRSWLNNH